VIAGDYHFNPLAQQYQHQQKSASELMAGTMAVSRLLYRKERGKDGKREKDVQVFCT